MELVFIVKVGQPTQVSPDGNASPGFVSKLVNAKWIITGISSDYAINAELRDLFARQVRSAQDLAKLAACTKEIKYLIGDDAGEDYIRFAAKIWVKVCTPLCRLHWILLTLVLS